MTKDEIENRMVKFYAKDDPAVTINGCQGHFATPQSHINYYIDVTRLKVRVDEAEEVAKSLKNKLLNRVSTVDTIVCLDGTEVLGAFLGRELEKADFHMTNTHETIYVVRPEENSLHQFMFRTNNRLAIEGKHVVVLAATITTGATISQALECIEYYGGTVEGVCSIFSTLDKISATQIYSLFTAEDLPGYATYSAHDCPYCAKKIPLEAMVNGYGYSIL